MFDVLHSIVIGYTASKKPMKIATNEELKRNNKITMDTIMDGLPDLVQVKVGQCSSNKEIWDKIHNLYSNGSLLAIIDPEHDNQDKEDDEIE